MLCCLLPLRRPKYSSSIATIQFVFHILEGVFIFHISFANEFHPTSIHPPNWYLNLKCLSWHFLLLSNWQNDSRPPNSQHIVSEIKIIITSSSPTLSTLNSHLQLHMNRNHSIIIVKGGRLILYGIRRKSRIIHWNK